MEETAQLVPPRNPGGGDASLAPPNPPLPICPGWLTLYCPPNHLLATCGFLL
ncbi:MAG: hypothetical protein HYW48_01485 [Deltaproteobacteria bacterium]|nr:hypothetical protein [Deltaproteobacteria bacterium]